MTEILYEAKQNERESLYKRLMDLQTLENQGIRISQRMIDEVYEGLRELSEKDDAIKLSQLRSELKSIKGL